MIAHPGEKQVGVQLTRTERSSTPVGRYATFSKLRPGTLQESAPAASALLSRSPVRPRPADLEVELARSKSELYASRVQLEQLQLRQRDADSLRAQREQLQAHNRTLQGALSAAEEAVAALTAQLEQQRALAGRSEHNLREVLDKSSALRLDARGRIISAEEMEARHAAETAGQRVVALTRERDRLSVENFELRRTAGLSAVAEELDEDALRLRVKNGLQIAELEAARERQRAGLLEDELQMLRGELRVLREAAPGDVRAYAELAERQTRQLLQLKSDNQTLAVAVRKLRREQQALLTPESDLDDPAELRKRLSALRAENGRLATEQSRFLSLAAADTALRAENDGLSEQVVSLQTQLTAHEFPAEEQPRLASLKESLARKLKRFM